MAVLGWPVVQLMDMDFSLLLTGRMLNLEVTDSCDARHNEEVLLCTIDRFVMVITAACDACDGYHSSRSAGSVADVRLPSVMDGVDLASKMALAFGSTVAPATTSLSVRADRRGYGPPPTGKRLFVTAITSQV